MNAKTKEDEWPVIYEAQDGTKFSLTKTGINMSGVGVAGNKLSRIIKMADTQNVLGTSEELQDMFRMQTTSGVENLIRALRLIGYEITVITPDASNKLNKQYVVKQRPETFPETLQFLRNSQVITPTLVPASNGQMSLMIDDYQGPCNHEKLPYPKEPPHLPIRSNIMMSQRDWAIYQSKIKQLYDEYCLFVDLFNSA